MNSERPDHDGTGTGTGTGGERARAGRRRPRSALTASVAAAVLLAGGGGAYLAATASGGPDGSGGGTSPGASGGGTPPPLTLDPEPAEVAADYRAGGPLPDGPDSAPVYRATGRVTEAEVARLAEALDLAGKPVARGASWTVGGSEDGSGPVLRVDREAPGNWTFQRAPAASDDCGRKDLTCGGAGPEGSGAGSADPVSEATARKAAAPVLAAVGQGGAGLDAGQVMGARRVVNAEPVVGGLPTVGWTTGVIVGPDGTVAGGSGRLAAPVKGDAYPVLDAERTLAALNRDPAGGAPGAIGGCASAVPLEGRPTGGPCGPGSGKATGTTATVERAVFGLAARTVAGQAALVPSWLFAVRAPGAADPVTVPYPAVDPAYLTSPRPSPAPSAGGKREERDVRVTGYTAEGTELTVRFTGGVCATYDAAADEGTAEVEVTVTEHSDPGQVCVLIAKEYGLTVRLDRPLGDRAVTGSDGEPVPLAKRGARLPAPHDGR